MVSPLIPLLSRTNSELKMKSIDAKYFNLGPRLTLTFALLVALILGGNGLLIWQFRIARLQADRLSGVSQQMISVLRLQGSLLSFHRRLGELAQSRNAYVLTAESESLQSTLLEQIQQTRDWPGFIRRLGGGSLSGRRQTETGRNPGFCTSENRRSGVRQRALTIRG